MTVDHAAPVARLSTMMMLATNSFGFICTVSYEPMVQLHAGPDGLGVLLPFQLVVCHQHLCSTSPHQLGLYFLSFDCHIQYIIESEKDLVLSSVMHFNYCCFLTNSVQ
jgi:hypothetical protein